MGMEHGNELHKTMTKGFVWLDEGGFYSDQMVSEDKVCADDGVKGVATGHAQRRGDESQNECNLQRQITVQNKAAYAAKKECIVAYCMSKISQGVQNSKKIPRILHNLLSAQLQH